ncbi:nicotinic acetylcholine receptor [Nesidiocoris tenuis]|uniref:Nicotinic acetylcholine receptor n=1 Tax=Nesidiocoris tenuis TaxID=355587 RepID=A0ABN7AED6_9HEMI|nr:nicotinic acetylcholine receptor [Nesidiocoris tenuis]
MMWTACNRPILAVGVVLLSAVLADDVQYRLTQELLSLYNAAVRPTPNYSYPLEVVFGVSIHHIIDVDEKNQILTTNCWLTQIWLDHHLRWNASDYDGIEVIRLPWTAVWKPDIILYNNADPQYNSAVINSNIILRHTGEVTWLSHGIYKSSCHIDVQYFPFDIQSCHMKWASWTYDGYQLELVQQTKEGDVSNYQPNGEFDLVSFTPIKDVKFYSCCNEPYPDITYIIQLRRRPMFYVFNLILPCILINCIALLVFYVPSESGEKVTLGISALLSMTVFLMTIRETLPPTEKTPLISLYYGVSICLVTFASGLSVVTLNVYHRGVRGTKVPPFIKNVVLDKLATILFLQIEPRPNKHGRQRTDTARSSKWMSAEVCNCLATFSSQRSPCFISSPNNSNSSVGKGTESFETHLLRMLHHVNMTIERNEIRLQEKEKREMSELEWKQVALVCDRLLLWLFLIVTAVTTSVILCGSPYGP